MKTADQILENIMCCTIEEDADLDVKSNYYYQHDDVIKAIEDAQKEAYNQAIDDVCDNIVVYDTVPRVYSSCTFNKESILKLKK